MEIDFWDNGKLIINKNFSGILKHNGLITAENLWKIHSDPVKKQLKERGTEMIYLEPEKGTDYIEAYIKRYKPVPVKERVKSLVSLKPGTYNAFHEWKSILAFHRHQLPTMVPIAACRIKNNTCIMTEGITDYKRASKVFASLKRSDFKRKRTLIRKIAELAANMHKTGLAHQDFYLVHIFIKEKCDDEIYLIDLQRVVMHRNLSIRWVIKDLAQLLFSARKVVQNTDVLFFWKKYCEIAGKNNLKNNRLINAILLKARRIRRHDVRRAVRKRRKRQK